MEGKPCLIKTKDWWSYELCYGSEIRQYHMEGNTIVSIVLQMKVLLLLLLIIIKSILYNFRQQAKWCHSFAGQV